MAESSVPTGKAAAPDAPAPAEGRRGHGARWMAVRIVLVVLLGIGAWLGSDWLTGSAIVLRNDFFQYWSGLRFALQGGNPYDVDALFAFQISLGWESARPIFSWNPPWALGLFLPLAWLRFGQALLAWILLQGALIVAATALLWREFSGSRLGERGIVFLTLAFPPALFTLPFGQISGWLLVGLACAILGQRRGREWLLGASLPLLLVKPHFTLLAVLAIVARAVIERRWAVVGWAAAVLMATLAIPLAGRPTLLFDYLTLLGDSQPREFVTDTVGAGLRLLAGWDRFWVQFLPLVVGLVWLSWALLRHRDPARWPTDALPLLALLSAVAAPYGWFFDMVVAIPALVLVWTWLAPPERRRTRRIFVAGYLSFCVVLSGLHLWLWDPMGFVHGWLPPFVLVAYLFLRRRLMPGRAAEATSLPRPTRETGTSAA